MIQSYRTCVSWKRVLVSSDTTTHHRRMVSNGFRLVFLSLSCSGGSYSRYTLENSLQDKGFGETGLENNWTKREKDAELAAHTLKWYKESERVCVRIDVGVEHIPSLSICWNCSERESELIFYYREKAMKWKMKQKSYSQWLHVWLGLVVY